MTAAKESVLPISDVLRGVSARLRNEFPNASPGDVAIAIRVANTSAAEALPDLPAYIVAVVADARNMLTAISEMTGPREPRWGAIIDRLSQEFQDVEKAEIIAEIVHARDSADFVGTEPGELEELVEFMVRYALQVRCGLVVPSDRLQPMPRTSTRREAVATA